ncbi:MAG: ABC transporter permease [Oscillospiraceae bacterium]|nr:ABC transporter permease [Candidatus Equicaccousia limihippi]
MRKSTGYLIKEGFKNVWANRLMSIASIGVLVACMTIIGLAILVTSNLNKGMNDLQNENVVMAYFNDKNSVLYPIDGSELPKDKNISEDKYLVHNEDEAKAVCEKIKALSFVNKVEYISAEQALENYKNNYVDGDSAYLVYLEGDENPMSMCAKVTFNSLENFDSYKEQIKAVEGVNVVVGASDVAKTVYNISDAIAVAGLFIVIILMIIALVIVSNTIRVTMYNRKLEISIMKAVGATDSFIRLPFLIEGIVLGLISAVLSLGITYGVYALAGDKIKQALGGSNLIAFRTMLPQLALLFVLIGILAGVIGSFIILGKYLKKEGSEFSAL